MAAGATSSALRVPSEYPTINDALDAALGGDSVLVAPGVYDQYETRQFPGGIVISSVAFLKAGVSLISEGGQLATTLRLDATLTTPTLCVGLDLGSTVTIDGFAFTGNSPGLSGAQLPNCDDCIVKNCTFRDFGSGGSAGGVGIACVRTDLTVIGVPFREHQRNKWSGYRASELYSHCRGLRVPKHPERGNVAVSSTPLTLTRLG